MTSTGKEESVEAAGHQARRQDSSGTDPRQGLWQKARQKGQEEGPGSPRQLFERAQKGGDIASSGQAGVAQGDVSDGSTRLSRPA